MPGGCLAGYFDSRGCARREGRWGGSAVECIHQLPEPAGEGGAEGVLGWAGGAGAGCGRQRGPD